MRVLCSWLLVAVPLFRYSVPREGDGWTVVYGGCLGVGGAVLVFLVLRSGWGWFRITRIFEYARAQVVRL